MKKWMVVFLMCLTGIALFSAFAYAGFRVGIVNAVKDKVDSLDEKVVQKKTTEAVINIGSVLPKTGALAAYGPAMENGVKLAVKEINDAGGVLGKKINLICRDSATTPDTAKTEAVDLISNYNVCAIMGAGGSGVSMKMAEACIANKVVQVSGSSTSPALTTLADNGYFWRSVPSDALQGKVMAQVAWDKGYRTIGILYINNAYGSAFKDVLVTNFTALGGTVAHTVGYPETTKESYAEEIAEVFTGSKTGTAAQVDVDVICEIGYVGETITVLKEWKAGGFGKTFILADGHKSTELVTGVNDATVTNGLIGTAPYVAESDLNHINFTSAYYNYFGKSPGIYSDTFYDAMILVGLAIQKAGSATGETIKDALTDVSKTGTKIGAGKFADAAAKIKAGEDIDYEGASGPVDFDSNGDVNGIYEVWGIMGSNIVHIETITP